MTGQILQYKGNKRIDSGRQKIFPGDYVLVVGEIGSGTTLLAKIMSPDITQEEAAELMGDLNNAASVDVGKIGRHFEEVR